MKTCRRLQYYILIAALLAAAPACHREPAPAKPPLAGVSRPGHPAPDQVRQIAALLPGSPLVFLYTPDLGAGLTRVLDSPVMTDYLQSPAMARFQESRLYLKLRERFEQLARLLDLQPALAELRPLAGGESALALYDIGELDFVYVTALPAEQLWQTALGAARGRATEAALDGNPYYILAGADDGRSLYFGIAAGKLVVGSSDQPFRETLARAADLDAAGPGLDHDPAFQQAFPADLITHDLLMYLDLAALAGDNHFKRYWIYNNLDDLAGLETAVADLQLGDGSWTERRFFAGQLPAAVTDHDLGGCPVLAVEAAFAECGPGPDSAQMVLDLLPAADRPEVAPGNSPGPEAPILTNLNALLAPGLPELAGSALRINWNDDRRFWNTAQTVAVKLAKPRKVKTRQLRDLIARDLAGRLFTDRRVQLAWDDDDYGTALSLPLFGNALWLDREDGWLVISTDGPLHREVLDRIRKDEPSPGAPGPAVYYSHWNVTRARDDFMRVSDALLRDPDWPRQESKTALDHDFRGLLDALQVREITRELRTADGALAETVHAFGPPPP